MAQKKKRLKEIKAVGGVGVREVVVRDGGIARLVPMTAAERSTG